MNASEVRLAIQEWNSDSIHKSLDSMGRYLHANGYLECLEKGPEVKVLVDVLRWAMNAIDAGVYSTKEMRAKFEVAFQNYRKSVNPTVEEI